MLRTAFWRLPHVSVIGLFVLFAGSSCGGGSCSSSKDNEPSATGCGERLCSAGVPSGPRRGLTADGRVDVTATEAWPNRTPDPSPLTPQDHANACALISACKLDTDGKPLTDDGIATLTKDCAAGASPSDAKEERAVLQNGQFERFAWEAHAALDGKHDCASLRALETPRPSEILCQEDGCWWESPTPAPPACCKPVPTVTCAGDVATLVSESTTIVRDCSRSYTKCDPHSSTGCTDRAPVGCDSAATDTCDGNVKLGCDSDGRVSFHDCARYPGGKCVSDSMGVRCDQGPKCDASKIGCNPTTKMLDLCVGGTIVSVDCVTLGMGECDKGHCVGK